MTGFSNTGWLLRVGWARALATAWQNSPLRIVWEALAQVIIVETVQKSCALGLVSKVTWKLLRSGKCGFFSCSPSPFHPQHRWQMFITCLSEHRLRLKQLQGRCFCKKREAEKCKSNKHNKCKGRDQVMSQLWKEGGNLTCSEVKWYLLMVSEQYFSKWGSTFSVCVKTREIVLSLLRSRNTCSH